MCVCVLRGVCVCMWCVYCDCGVCVYVVCVCVCMVCVFCLLAIHSIRHIYKSMNSEVFLGIVSGTNPDPMHTDTTSVQPHDYQGVVSFSFFSSNGGVLIPARPTNDPASSGSCHSWTIQRFQFASCLRCRLQLMLDLSVHNFWWIDNYLRAGAPCRLHLIHSSSGLRWRTLIWYHPKL